MNNLEHAPRWKEGKIGWRVSIGSFIFFSLRICSMHAPERSGIFFLKKPFI